MQALTAAVLILNDITMVKLALLNMTAGELNVTGRKNYKCNLTS